MPISFARGAPSLDIMPAEQVRECADRVLREDPAGALSYGPGSGYPPLRDWIAGHHAVEPERVMVTNGSLEAGIMLFRHLVGPDKRAIVEAPTYDRTLLALRQLGADVRAVALEDDGIDVAALERALGSGATPELLHTIPNFHNPAGCTLASAKRTRLLELAAEHGFVIFEDDPYGELRFEGEDVPTMLSADTSQRVIFASSFSKTIAPGVRVGYLIGPEEPIAALTKVAVNTYISPNVLSQAIVYEFCRSGEIERSIATVKRTLRERRDAVAEGLRAHLGDEARFVLPEGGYFLWVELPEEVDTRALLVTAAERGVTFVPGGDFFMQGGDNTLRLAYSAVTPDQATEGTRLLGDAVQSLRAGAAA